MRSVLIVLLLVCASHAYNSYPTRRRMTPYSRHRPSCIPVTKKIIETVKAPILDLPFSQAVLAGNTLYLAGQIGRDPVTLQLVPGGIIPETIQIFRNIGAVLEAAGGNFKDVVKVTVFLTKLSDLTAFNTVYTKFFPNDFPARVAVQVVAVPLMDEQCIDVD
ncbi:2-iminobutanoate/2-iminopropanoate deaminase-like [Mytilus trossulus]|uniref:2-iminobutanoate/2-iminopropanoate deaminase-like n=1 Tax=Mytilus trossulus TaxID=6551 RepID=UPI003006043F